ncbi:MAG TPA: class I SAM-dependent methyltransferase [Syntrophomonadaceae bacterium]|nr:class I SAM-dependent methyltransferase [Syntrophomonadaceae bacterium]
MNLIITDSHREKEADAEMAEFIVDCGFPYYPRKGSLARMSRQYEADGIIVWLPEGPVLHMEDEKFFFHPSMSRTRLGLYRKRDIIDPLVRACQLESDDHFLDCTLGLGADSIVASYFLPQGRVVGIESSPGIASVVKWGMKRYQSEYPWLREAIQRVEVVNMQHLNYLQNMVEDSFDVVYFDPMFRHPLLHSQPLAPLRLLANPAPLEPAVVEEACRVARKRVILKERHDSGEFERLGFDEIIMSRHNPIAFGRISLV